MKLLDKLVPQREVKRRWTAIGITGMLAGLLTIVGIYGIGQYGIALFILTPVLIGALSTILYGYKAKITRKQAWHISFSTLGVFSFGLLLFGIEGLICMAMAAPFALPLTWIGSLIGHLMLENHADKGPSAMITLVLIIPLTGFVERTQEHALTSVVTSIDVAADPETVWRNVVEFPRLKEPAEFLFKTGIAYPIDAKIIGTGVGAVRHCNFTTGSFVEPITVWEKPKLLKFSVLEQPAPMREISFWDIDVPHLHDYFVSKQGQFKLIPLPNGKTRLEGTTWYYHDIKPVFYWRLWSNYIIHQIHQRVLTHIKANSENG